tara:strand:- start:299 stop:541 length:243 start_codon:yes stop_codon:yes gene_type:complete
MKQIIFYIKLYYPVVLSFISFLYSVGLWFTGHQLEGIFVGIWVPSILALSICIRQRRNDYYRALAASKRYYSKPTNKKRK